MQPRLARRKGPRQSRPDIPHALQGIGLAIVIGFLLWTMAMVFMQAWQVTPFHRK